MPFDYLHPKVAVRYQKILAQRFTQTRMEEVQQRARLLRNLNYPLEAAIWRIQRNVIWEFELDPIGIPAYFDRIDETVRRVYEPKS